MANLPRIVKKTLPDLLKEEGLVKDDVLLQASAQQKQSGMPYHRIFHRMGILSETELARCVSKQMGLPLLDASSYKVNAEVVVPLFDYKLLEQHLMVPLDRIGKVLLLAIAGPPPQDVIDAVEKTAGCPAFLVISAVAQIEATITKYYKQGSGPLPSAPAAAGAGAPAGAAK